MNKLLLNLTLASALAAGAAQAAISVNFNVETAYDTTTTVLARPGDVGSLASTATVSKALDLNTADIAATSNPAVYLGYYGTFTNEAGLSTSGSLLRTVNGNSNVNFPDRTDYVAFIAPQVPNTNIGQTTADTATMNGVALFEVSASGAFAAGNALSAQIGRQGNTSFSTRWVVLNAGALYVSGATTGTINSVFNEFSSLTTQTMADPAAETWYAWTPGNEFNTIGLTTAGVLGSTFTDIEKVGIQFEWSQTNTGGQTFGIAEVTAVPEPSTYAALLGALALGFVAVRRRMKR